MLKLHDFCNRARYSIGVGATGFELDFWARVRNLSDAARSQYLATVQAERAFRLASIRDVASTYFASREAAGRFALRSEERRIGMECVCQWRSRWSPDNQKHKSQELNNI